METDEDERALAVHLEAIEHAQTMAQAVVRRRAAEEFNFDWIGTAVITTLESTRLGGSFSNRDRRIITVTANIHESTSHDRRDTDSLPDRTG